MTSYTVTTKVNNPNYDCSADFTNTAFDKAVEYIIRVNNTKYEAISGATGRLVYGGADDEGSVDGDDDSAVIAAVLAAVTSGVVLLNGVAFDLTQFGDIPENVRVVCNYGAEHWEYINSADSSGSPYTVSVGSGVNVGYYLAQDGEGRICYSSTDASAVLRSITSTTPGTVVFSGDQTYTSAVNWTTGGWHFKGDATLFVNYNGYPLFNFAPTTTINGVVFEDLSFTGIVHNENHFLGFVDTTHITVLRCNFTESGDEAITFGSGVVDATVRDCHFVSCSTADPYGSSIDLQGTNTVVIENNYIDASGAVGCGIAFEAGVADPIYNTKIIGNTILTPTTYGIFVGGINSNVYDTEIAYNTIRDAGIMAIIDATSGSYSVKNIDIHHNYISGGGDDTATRGAITLGANTPEDVKICFNTIEDWGTANVDSKAIYVKKADYAKIIGNTIYSIGGEGITAGYGAVKNIISGNTLNATQLASTNGAIMFYGSNSLIENNIITDGYRGIRLTADGANNVVRGNILSGNTLVIADASTATELYWNQGYEIGYITSPLLTGGDIIVDSGTNSAWVSATTYTNTQSPKNLYLSGNFTSITVSGTTLPYTNGEVINLFVHLEPNDTIRFVSDDAEILVYAVTAKP